MKTTRAVVSLLPVLAFGIFFVACDTSMEPSRKPNVSAVVNVPFRLAAGQTAVFADEDLSVTFVRVLSDGRCPIDAMCIVAGDATMAVYARQVGKAPKTLDLTLLNSLQAVDYEGFGFHARYLLPGKPSDEPIPPADYSVELLVDGP